MFYAQLNGAGVCVAVTQPRAALDGPMFVQIASLDASYLGRTYSAGAWL